MYIYLIIHVILFPVLLGRARERQHGRVRVSDSCGDHVSEEEEDDVVPSPFQKKTTANMDSGKSFYGGHSSSMYNGD